MPRKQKPLKKFVCSLAYDISAYSDFVVEATSEAAANRKIQKALREHPMDNVDCEVCWENGVSNTRMFVQGEATEYSPNATLDDIIKEANEAQGKA